MCVFLQISFISMNKVFDLFKERPVFIQENSEKDLFLSYRSESLGSIIYFYTFSSKISYTNKSRISGDVLRTLLKNFALVWSFSNSSGASNAGTGNTKCTRTKSLKQSAFLFKHESLSLRFQST